MRVGHAAGSPAGPGESWDEAQSSSVEVAGLGNEYGESPIRNSKVIGLSDTDTCEWIIDKLSQSATSINSQIYGFELQGIFKAIQLAEYGDSFDWHLEFGAGDASTRKLSNTLTKGKRRSMFAWIGGAPYR